jgi:IAA-amino acid hydrolase
MLLGAARILKRLEPDIRGTVKLLFQPAEEGGAGGRTMCEEGALDAPTVQQIFGLHVWPFLPTGTIGSRAGTLLAAAGSFKLTITGQGGHAAMPHLTVDPVSTAAKVVCELQTLVSRELDPLDSGVVTVTALQGGEAFNVIPAQVRMLGTVRSLTTSGLDSLKVRVQEIARHVTAANRCRVEIEFPGHDYPATVNEPLIWKAVQGLGREIVGERNVHEVAPFMGCEDFAYYLGQTPGCFVLLGVRNQSIDAVHSVHHPKFTVDENALHIGAAVHAAFALDALDRLGVPAK